MFKYTREFKCIYSIIQFVFCLSAAAVISLLRRISNHIKVFLFGHNGFQHCFFSHFFFQFLIFQKIYLAVFILWLVYLHLQSAKPDRIPKCSITLPNIYNYQKQNTVYLVLFFDEPVSYKQILVQYVPSPASQFHIPIRNQKNENWVCMFL